MPEHILEVKDIKVRYASLSVIQGLSLNVDPGETVCVVGANGAGKSTFLKAIMGSVRVFDGEILFFGRKIDNLKTEEIVRTGITYVPEERMLFTALSVEENLLLGAYTLSDKERIEKNLQFVYSLFPVLRERCEQAALTLSGGEQQMVAIGRGLMQTPVYL